MESSQATVEQALAARTATAPSLRNRLRPLLRGLLALTGAAAGAVALVLAWPGASLPAGWPWSGGLLAEAFVASVLAAVAVPMLWAAWHGRLAVTVPGFVHVATMAGGFALVLGNGPSGYAAAAGVALAIAGASLLAHLWVRGEPASDARRLPASLAGWSMLYVAILLVAGSALLRGTPGVMPWPVTAQASQIYGWVFIAAAWSFAYPLLTRRVEHVQVGLIGFLAYDLVLVPPFALHLPKVAPALHTSLVLYLTALVASLAVSVWYLAFSRATRPFGAAPRQ